jgi:large subunit ribosomal protein L4
MVKTGTMKQKTSKAQGLTVKVFDSAGKTVEQIQLNPKVFDGRISPALMHQATTAYLANQRQGTASAKTRGQVRGGGTKPWRQKGTGRARVGSIRSPLWRGGGATFGPKPRSYYKNLPKKMKILALKSALNAKLKDSEIMVLKDLAVNSPKTKTIAAIIVALDLESISARFVVETLSQNLKLAIRNISQAGISQAADICATEIINCKKLVLTKQALRRIEERVEKWLQ